MTKKADIGSKRLISLAPDNWARWLTQQPDVQVQEFLNSEFQWVSRANDVLLKVSSPRQGEFLLLNEIQFRYTNQMPQRIRAYAGLATERYNLPVYPVLINILPHQTNSTIPTSYSSEFMGIRAHQDYRVINLWEVSAEIVFREKISTLLPFVPILKGGGEETVVRTALRELRADENLQDLEPLLSFFASFVLEIPIVQEIMRWDMTVLRESPWYQEILKEGLQLGEQRGLQLGRQEGRQEGETELIIRLLNRRFGNLDLVVTEKIKSLSIPQLEALGDRLLDFSNLEEFLLLLNEQR
jgi:predicted transposase YdaD